MVESDPILFLAGLIAACSRGHYVFLANPTWGLSEWQQVLDLVAPDLVWGNCECAQQCYETWRSRHQNNTNLSPNLPKSRADSLIMIPTGGSSGKIRFAMHRIQQVFLMVKIVIIKYYHM